jgi:GalNAc-alpha-(1->4)-GalNAc-alpha-(1->3)-diNAcBac-PP-undecaprenol alpha-1,4-N-acetyl-D-galactosaminyltransferase
MSRRSVQDESSRCRSHGSSLRIAFVISSIKAGGAQRVATLLTRAWSVRGHVPFLVTFEASGTAPAFELSGAVSLVQLNLASTSDGVTAALRNNWSRIRALRRCLIDLQPDIVVSFETETNVLTLAAGLLLRRPTVVSERTHPAHHPIGRAWSILRRLTYIRASAVVAQTDQISSWLRTATFATTKVIPNPVDMTAFQCGQGSEKAAQRRKVLLAVGRLIALKGFDIIVEAFAIAANRIPDWDLKICGEGSSRSAIEQHIAEHDMRGRISLDGESGDMGPVYRFADAFVHASQYEGYPNVIVEALASGLPVIAIDSPGAVRDLLGGGKFGQLVEKRDPETLAEALVSVLNNDEKLRSFSRQAPLAVKGNELGLVAETWLKLFWGLISKSCVHSQLRTIER